MMIITLCGSARFEREYKYWNEKLSLQGHAVFSLSVYPSDKEGDKDWYTEDEKKILDMVHKAKIVASNAIVVVNRAIGEFPGESYIGASTRSEIDLAEKLNMPVQYTANWGLSVPENLRRRTA